MGFLGCSLVWLACKVARCEFFPSYPSTQLVVPHNLTPWCPSPLLPLFFQLSLPSTFSAPEEVDEAFHLLNYQAGAQVQFSSLSSGES